MSVLVLNRKQQPIVYNGSGSQTIIQLNKGLIYRQLFLRLFGQVANTGANNTPANLLPGDEWGCIKNVQLVANGSDVMWSMSGNQLAWYNFLVLRNAPKVSLSLTNTATANPIFSSTLLIPFWALNAVRPFDSAFYSGEVTDFRLVITWGNYTDIFSTATAWTAAPQLEVGSNESGANMVRTDGTAAPLPGLSGRTVAFIQQPAAASPAFRFPLDIGPQYRGFLINTTTTANPAVDTPALFSNVKLVSGSTTFFDMSEAMLADVGLIQYGQNLEQGITSAGVAYQAGPRLSSSSNRLGWYNLDLVNDGRLTECVDSQNLSELYLEFALTAGCTINLIARQYYAIARAQAAPTANKAKTAA